MNINLLNKIKSLWGEAYYVGGCVRDYVMWLEPHDFDIATNVPMDLLEANFETYDIGKNKDFWVMIINYEGVSYDVAQFRADWIYSDGRHPEQVSFVKTIEEDLARRDFTINAMAFDGEKIIDPYGGQEDIQKKKIRFVGNAADRIKEDALRILRAYRFAAKFKFDLVDEDVMDENQRSIDWLSQERITQELIKVAWYGGRELAFFIDRMYKNGIYIIPQLQDDNQFFAFPHQLRHHPEGNVYNHIIHCLCSPKQSTNYLVNLCILFHDIGKFETLEYRDWRPTYYWHDAKGAEMMDEIGKELKLSNDDIETIKFVCKNHMYWWYLKGAKRTKKLELALHKDYDILTEVCFADEMSRLYMASETHYQEVYDEIAIELEKVKSAQELKDKLSQLVDGNKIIEWLWVSGKDVGKYLKIAQEWIIENDFKTVRHKTGYPLYFGIWRIEGEDVKQFILKEFENV